MTRKKVKLAFITNDSARKATLKKRKKGLMKKVSELSTLCGIDACAIIYSPYENQPEVWPSTAGAQRVVAQFKRMPEMEQSKKMVNQEGFIRQRIAKASEQLKKQHKENREKEITEVMYQCLTGKGLHSLILTDLNDLAWLLDQKLKEISKKMEDLKKAAPPAAAASQPAAAAPQEEGIDLGQRPPPQWFAEWMMSNNQQMGFEHGGGGGGGGAEEMMMPPFNENHHPIPMWPAPGGAFFP
ncbi:PREDICTED: agamous-like MADS-box protein AGL80 [Ipomoea nil]|uniref:agamous-like MADS-box protein AGL80 n=1 Tax=Ipomoea nil TaxID=35883 RepID=UPI0009009365|nr:PREDICTED: agamous-like MADS-box protein AGL80 [Ipomoea nil]